ncbi:hypothetical protein [Bacillus sp. B1-b2]|uniref:hypothetical protein n=1 Tax=Bacillus sp. B1-b2 TaxID=2653201 RepID=UPI001261B2B4|nr:hypothetical protein [Bacillus sp. B1-b2]KAB7666037.1 hypothetical protein F9279_18645 [Bacillus sp. B1-b2]
MTENVKKDDYNVKQFYEAVGWSKATFYRRIKEIFCTYDLDHWKFRKAGEEKEDPTKGDTTFIFKSEWRELAELLCKLYDENPYFRANTDIEKLSLNDLMNFNKDTLKKIENLSDEQLRYEIMLHPAYLASIAETKALKGVTERISFLLRSVEGVSIETRTAFWLHFANMLNKVVVDMYLFEIDTKEKIEQEKGPFKDVLFGELEVNSLDFLVAEFLKKMQDKEHAAKREDVTQLYDESEKQLDELVASSDSPDEQRRVNEMFERLIGDDVINEIKISRIRNQVKEKLTQAAELGSQVEGIDKTIERYISTSEESENQKAVGQLMEVQEKIKSLQSQQEKYIAVAETLLYKVNATITDRRK